MSEPTWTDLAAAYVLDALDPEETKAFERRLEIDAALRAEVRAQREALAALADAAPPRKAPASLRERVLEEARSVRPIRSAGGAGSSGEPGRSARHDGDAPTSAGDAPPSGRRPVLPWIVAAAATVAAVALGVSNRQLADRVTTTDVRLSELRAAVQAADVEVARRDSLLAALLGPDVRTASLAATGAEPSARLFWNEATGEVVVTAFGLPPAPEGRTYQLWGIGEGADPVSLGTFQTSADGTAVVRASAPPDAEFDISAMTEEPAGGSPQPTSTPFLVGSWTGD